MTRTKMPLENKVYTFFYKNKQVCNKLRGIEDITRLWLGIIVHVVLRDSRNFDHEEEIKCVFDDI